MLLLCWTKLPVPFKPYFVIMGLVWLMCKPDFAQVVAACLVMLMAVVVGGVAPVRAVWVEGGLRFVLSGPPVAGLRPGVALCFRAGGAVHGGPFARSVVLIAEYSHHGALGYVINKPLELSAAAIRRLAASDHWVRDAFAASDETVAGGRRSFMEFGYGGPVSEGWEVIHRHGMVRGSRTCGIDDVFVGGGHHIAHAEAPLRAAHHLRSGLLVRGYAGWYPGQVDAEVRRGAWSVHNVTAELLWSTPLENLYDVIAALPREELEAPQRVPR